MKRSIVLVAVLGCLVGAGDAGAVTLVTPEGEVSQPFQRLASGARVPTALGRVTLHMEACPALAVPHSCAYPADIYLYPPNLTTRRYRRFILLHELGHVFDWQQLDDAERSLFAPLPWSQTDRERFANLYAACGETGSTVRACALIRRAGGWSMRPAG